MRIGAVLGGASRGFKDTYSKMEEWDKAKRERETRERIAAAAAEAPTEETVVGSMDQPLHSTEWSQQNGVPPEVASQGLEAVQQWIAANAQATATAPAATAAGQAFDDAIEPVSPGMGAIPTSPTDRPAQAAAASNTPNLTGWYSYQDRIGGQTFYTRRPRYAQPTDRIDRIATAMEESGDPAHVARAAALRSNALALQLQADEVARSRAERAITQAMRLNATGQVDAAVQLIQDTFNEGIDDGTYVRFSRDDTGQLQRQFFHSDTGTPVSKPVAVNMNSMLEELMGTVSSDNYFKVADKRRADIRAMEESAKAAVEQRRLESETRVAEATEDDQVAAIRLKPRALQAGIAQTEASTADTRAQTEARRALLPGQLAQQGADLDDTRATTAARSGPRPAAALSDAQQRAVNDVVSEAEEAAAAAGLKPGTPQYLAEVRRRRDAGVTARGIRLPGTIPYAPPTPNMPKPSSGLGPRTPPRLPGGRTGSANHGGVDFPYRANTPFASVEGRVRRAGPMKGYGQTIEVEMADGRGVLRYSHLNGVRVRPGDSVVGGQIVGVTGNTGNSTGAHLHVEWIKPDGSRGDPREIFRQAEPAPAALPTGKPRRAPAGASTVGALSRAAPSSPQAYRRPPLQ